MNDSNELLNGLILELKRGTLILGVLSRLHTPQCGYVLVKELEDKGISADPSTLYPLLRRLEKQGLLCSEWDLQETKPRKYYRRTELGDQIFQNLKDEWLRIEKDMRRLLEI